MKKLEKGAMLEVEHDNKRKVILILNYTQMPAQPGYKWYVADALIDGQRQHVSLDENSGSWQCSTNYSTGGQC